MNEETKDIREELKDMASEADAAPTEDQEQEQLDAFADDPEPATDTEDEADDFLSTADLVAIVEEGVAPIKEDVELVMKSLASHLKFQKSVKGDSDLMLSVLDSLNDRIAALEKSSQRIAKSVGTRQITPPAPTSDKDDVRQRLAKSAPVAHATDDSQLEKAEQVFVKSFLNNADADAKVTVAVQNELSVGRIHPALKAEMEVS